MGKRQFKKYSEDFRKSSAKLAIESDNPLTKTAEALGVNAMTLYSWVNKYYPNYKAATKISSKDIDIEAENKQLRKELARVKEERDILKKAAAYFASQAQ